MGIEFARYEFLEFFDLEKIIDSDIYDIEYTLKSNIHFTFKLHIIAVEEYASITLEHDQLEYPIFNIGFNSIVKMTLTKDNDNKVFLNFFKNEENELFKYQDKSLIEPFFKVMLLPSVNIQVLSQEYKERLNTRIIRI